VGDVWTVRVPHEPQVMPQCHCELRDHEADWM
jgi:hypothetical protein